MLPSSDSVALSVKPPVIMLEGRLPVLEAPTVKALGLHDGQVVRPTVEAREGRLALVLQGRVLPFPLPAEAKWVAGEKLAYRVQTDAQGTARLLPLPSDTATRSAMTLPQRLEQLNLRPLDMAAMAHVLRPGVLQTLLAASPQPEVGRLVEQVLRLRPSLAQVTAQGLRHWIANSGWFLESQLASRYDASRDAKGMLRHLQSVWNQAPDHVTRLLSEAIDDIEAAQLQAGQDVMNAGRDGWISMVLPFSDAEPVHLRFKKRRTRDDSAGERAPLVIDLHTRSRDLGDVWLHTRISDETQVQMTMWATQEDVVLRARAAVNELGDAMDDAGLVLLGLQVVHGARTTDGTDRLADGAGRLVDVQA